MKNCLTLAALLALSLPAQAADISRLAQGWQTFLQTCGPVFRDPETAIQNLPLIAGQGATVSLVRSADGTSWTAAQEGLGGILFVTIDTLPDRTLVFCEVGITDTGGWTLDQIGPAYRTWLAQSPGVTVVGGDMTAFDYPGLRHTVLGLLPEFDLAVQSEIYPDEANISAERVIPTP